MRQRFKEWRAVALAAVVKMQAVVRGKLARKLYYDMQAGRREIVALHVQSVWRGVMYVCCTERAVDQPAGCAEGGWHAAKRFVCGC